MESGFAAKGTPVRVRGLELITILIAINCLNMLDRNLPFILAEAIKADLHLSDKQIGLLGGAVFAAFYAFGGLPFGKLAGKGLARQIVALAVAGWSAMTALGGLAQNFAQLAAARLGVAAGEAALAPAAHTLIADFFPEQRRGTMIALFSLGTPIGFMLGLALGGWLLDRAGWRMAFLIIGVPGLLLSLYAWVRLPRAPMAAHDDADIRIFAAVRLFWAKPTFRATVYASALFSFVSYTMNTFMPAFYMRSYGLNAAQTGLWLGLIIGVSGLIGMPLAGWLSDRLAQRNPGWRLRISALQMAIGAPFLLAALLAKSWIVSLALLFVPQMLIISYLGPTFSAVHAIVPPRLRALSTSCLLGLLTLFGASFGPLGIGAISDWLEPSRGVDALATALLALPPILILSALIFEVAARRLPHDLPADPAFCRPGSADMADQPVPDASNGEQRS